MTGIEIWVVFTLGLVSSLHCVQMCGPIVLSYSVALDQVRTGAGRAPGSLLSGHLAYNAGRILTYSALGAAAGLAGKTVGLIGRLAGVTSALAIVGGVLMLMAGLVMFGAFPAVQAFGGSFFRITSSFLRPLEQPPGVAQRRQKIPARPGAGISSLRTDLRCSAARTGNRFSSLGSRDHGGFRCGHGRRFARGRRFFVGHTQKI